MKLKIGFSIACLFVSFSLPASQSDIHLDLEMSSKELRQVLKSRGLEFSQRSFNQIRGAYKWSPERVASIGERLFKWIDDENSRRTPQNAIRLTDPTLRRGIPITSPKRYGPASISNEFEDLQAQLPATMKDILFSSKPFPNPLPLTDDEFILYARKLDRQYQTATRWILLEPYKSSMARRKVMDIRGYYFLTTEGWTETTLATWETLTTDEQTKIRGHLEGICINAREQAMVCRTQTQSIQTGAQAVNVYKTYIQSAQRVYNSFFNISNARRDILWSSANPTVATIPFVDPKSAEVQHFLKSNIEDEYRWNGWKLVLNFVPSGPAPFVEFVPGVTPNVSGLGENRIQMDANQSIHEYEVGWVIRHEFGHVLGFPDCYHEFYESSSDEFINYQIDITDLMCSRAGDFNERLYNQMKSAYMKP